MGVSRYIKVNVSKPKATPYSSSCCATYVAYDTIQPLYKGFGKYQVYKKYPILSMLSVAEVAKDITNVICAAKNKVCCDVCTNKKNLLSVIDIYP